MLSKTFACMIIISFVSAVSTGNLENVSSEFARSLSDAVTLCVSLLGMMCFWSGFMNVLRDSGVLKFVTRFLKPVIRLIFGKYASENENLENLSASVSANFLGLGNAALPFGIKAVKGLEKNNNSSKASDAAILFAVLNTVPFQLIPSTLIAMRTNYGSQNPFDVVPYIWLCSALITVFAIMICKIFSYLWRK